MDFSILKIYRADIGQTLVSMIGSKTEGFIQVFIRTED